MLSAAAGRVDLATGGKMFGRGRKTRLGLAGRWRLPRLRRNKWRRGWRWKLAKLGLSLWLLRKGF